MDSYYVIDITNDLASLENDYANWVGLPFNFRKRGDEECIRRYNCTNTDLFNRIKANLIEQAIKYIQQAEGKANLTGPEKMDLVIETHSPTIINRIGRRISEGKLSPNDVNVIIFNKSTSIIICIEWLY